MAGVKLSAVIITFNEELNIERCILSLKDVADEILVVDSFSTDNTQALCEKNGVRFLQHPFEGHIEQKNYAMSMASHDYVLSLDADEVLSDELQSAVRKVKSDWEGPAYAMNRLTNHCGAWIRHCGWYPDRKIRLWDRRKGKWQGENPHDRVVMQEESSVHTLPGDILHYSFRTYSDHLKQLDKFSTIAARDAFKRGKKVNYLVHIILYPWVRFIQLYFFRLGFLDGASGFTVCITDAFYRFAKYTKLWMLYREERRSMH